MNNFTQFKNKNFKNILDKIVGDKKTGEYRLKNKRDKEPSLFEDF